jgi:diguanylate cyclase (GGDEF)-like protein/PAS domain S-box-containing protein
VTDPGGRLLSVNPAFTKITGYASEEVIGKRLNILSSGRHDESFYRDMWHSIQTTGTWEGDIWNRRKNGEVYAERLIINTCYDDDGAPRYRIGLFSDITKQKEADAFIWRQANYDHLTGLPNRQLFHDRLEKEMKRSDTSGRPLALVYLDLDDFKELNDTLGHNSGDKLLVLVAERLQACIRSTDTVARLGGDEFVFILGGLTDTDVVDHICALALERLSEPFLLDGEHATISASMGITFYPNDGHSVKDLLQNADLAMYAAKARGKNQKARFQPSMQAHVAMRRELARDLSIALQERQFRVIYQPIVDLASGRIEKVECLVRWQHPEKGMVSPAMFIPFAEDTGMITPIGEWVFIEAMRQVAQWREIRPSLQAGINVSPVQFASSAMSPAKWLDHLATLELDPRQVAIEITERLLMEADSEVTGKLLAFRDAGVQMALDDFGTGYSSMSYLKRFDIDYIKIDQSFIRNLAPGTEDLVLCEAMIVMAHRLGLKVVAEGVETLAQRDLLLAAGCDYAQGYLYSRPVEAERFEALLRQGIIAAATSSAAHHSSTGALAHRT